MYTKLYVVYLRPFNRIECCEYSGPVKRRSKIFLGLYAISVLSIELMLQRWSNTAWSCVCEDLSPNQACGQRTQGGSGKGGVERVTSQNKVTHVKLRLWNFLQLMNI